MSEVISYNKYKDGCVINCDRKFEKHLLNLSIYNNQYGSIVITA